MKGKLVLVVEDHKPIATLLRRLVERCGARTQVAHDGRQALAMMQTERPDLVLLDLIMPVMDGQELMAAMAADLELKQVPVVVISTEDNLDDKLEAGVPHLCKPFDPAAVERLVREGLGGAPTPPAAVDAGRRTPGREPHLRGLKGYRADPAVVWGSLEEYVWYCRPAVVGAISQTRDDDGPNRDNGN